FEDLEGNLAGPDEAFDSPGFGAARSPAAAGAAGEQGPVGTKTNGNDARREALAEREAGALIPSVHLFQKDAHHGAVRLVADKELLIEGAKLAAALVAVDAGGGLTHLAIGKENASRH